ncbi:MAG TPA: hypothetical protein VIF09_26885 [Polyangiaceae bacterium]
MRPALLLAALLSLACACGSYEHDAQQRTANLRAVYPPGRTTRAQVRSRLGSEPAISRSQPASGWNEAMVLDVVRATGRSVAMEEEYVLPDATSFYPTLSRVWFFWDHDGVLVDVRWGYMSD